MEFVKWMQSPENTAWVIRMIEAFDDENTDQDEAINLIARALVEKYLQTLN